MACTPSACASEMTAAMIARFSELSRMPSTNDLSILITSTGSR